MHSEIFADWAGGIDLRRVRAEDFTRGMRVGAWGIYAWGAERNGAFRTLYIGQSADPLRRQRAHLSGAIGEKLDLIRRQGWQPKFWVSFIGCREFCRGSNRYAGQVLNDVEKALIYKLKPDWNRANAGYTVLGRPIRIENMGRRPRDVPRIVRLSEGAHV